MRFNCGNCAKELNIPDEKLPQAPRFKIKCPHCQKHTVVDRSQGKSELEYHAAGPGGYPEDEHSRAPSSLEPEVFPPGARVYFMLVGDKKWRSVISSFFQEKGYFESTARSVDEAVLKLRLNDYNVLIIGDDSSNAPILEEIAGWSGLKRREVNIIFIGSAAASMDPQMAFQKGINSYLNTNDPDRGEELLGKTLAVYENYYRYLRMAEEG